MICSIIRDLLPLYEEQICSKETAELVQEHLKECDECRKLYDEMRGDIGLREVVNSATLLNVEPEGKGYDRKNQEFWRKYYGSLLLKGVGIFIVTYTVVVSIWMIIGGAR